MAKINIEIDGKNAILKIDGKEVENLSSFRAMFFKDDCYCDGRVQNYVDLTYCVDNETNDEFPSQTRFEYRPATASFDDGKKVVNTKSPTVSDYGRM